MTHRRPRLVPDLSHRFPLEDRTVPATVGDFVWLDQNFDGIQDADEPGVANVVVQIGRAGPDGFAGTIDDQILGTAVTGDDGKYQFTGLPAASDYFVSFRTTSQYQYTLLKAGASDVDSDVNFVGRTALFALATPDVNLTIDAGLTLRFDAPAFGQAFAVGFTEFESANAVALDAAGNYYLAGEFEGLSDFDPGPGEVSRQSNGLNDIFVAKYTAKGVLLWVATAGGGNFDGANAVAVDPTGVVVVAGEFSDTVDFDPGPGVSNLSNSGGGTFVWKLSGDGQLVWAKGVSGISSSVSPTAVAVDDLGNVYHAGRLQGFADFDPGTGVFNLSSDSFSVDGYVSKLTAAGDFVSAGLIGGENADRVNALAVTGGGRVFAGGVFSGAADLDPTAGQLLVTGNGGDTGFVVELGDTGAFVNGFTVGTGSGVSAVRALAVEPGSGGPGAFDIFAAGDFIGTLDFDPNPGTSIFLQAAGGTSPFAVKFQNSGQGVWGAAADSEDGRVSGIAVDDQSRVYVTGQFSDFADFDPSPTADYTLKPVGGRDGFVWQLDAAGAFLSARTLGGFNDETVAGIALTPFGDLLVAGSFSGLADFDPGAGIFDLTSSGNSADAFVLRLSPNAWVRGVAWRDADADGVRGPADGRMTGLTLALRSAGTDGIAGTDDDFTITPAVSNTNGEYQIETVPTGGAYLLYSAVPGDGLTTANAGTDDVDSDADPATLRTAIVVPQPFEIVRNLDAGYKQAAPPAFGLAARFGSTAEDVLVGVTTDAAGNIFSVGTYTGGPFDLDPGPADVFINQPGSTGALVTKQGADGRLVWAKYFAGVPESSNSARAEAIALDGNGAVFVAGEFTGAIDFDPGPGEFFLNSQSKSGTSPFILRLDAAGNFQSAVTWGSSGGNVALSDIALSPQGGVVAVGEFDGAPDFDPGTGIQTLSTGTIAAYVLRLDGSLNFVRADSLGDGGTAFGRAVAVDNAGTIYTTGNFLGTGDFDPGPGKAELSSVDLGVFIVALAADGTLTYTKALVPTSTPGFVDASDIAVSADGRAVVVGQFSDAADFDPGPGVDNRTAAGSDWFAVRFDKAGNREWAATAGGVNDDAALGVALGTDGDVYLTGYFQGTADFDPGPAANSMTSAGAEDAFTLRLTGAAGSYVAARRFGGHSSDYGVSLALDAAGAVLSAGQFADAVNFDPDAGQYPLVAAGAGDAVVYRLAASYFAPLGTGTVVTNTLDAGPGSLRQAILNANLNPGTDTISFDIGSGAALPTIAVLSPLPIITDAVVIDGFTQKGTGTTPRVVLSGAKLPPDTFNPGLEINAGNTTIRGLVVQGFADGTGIEIGGFGSTGVTNVVVELCYVGTDETGAKAVANANGVSIGNGASGNRVVNCVISGNESYGVKLGGAAANNLVDGNIVGLTADGLKALSNGFAGFGLAGGAADNLIQGNVISANVSYAVLMFESGTGNTFLNNLIGTDVTGLSLPAGTFMDTAGIAITDTAGSKIIGNTISGTNSVAIALGTGAKATTVSGNRIGTDKTGDAILGNPIGLLVHDGASLTDATGNQISGNAFGIVLTDAATVDNVFTNNLVNTNATGTALLGSGLGVRVESAVRTKLSDNVIAGGTEVNFAAAQTSIVNNFLGVAKDGTTVLPATQVSGIKLDDATATTVSGNQIRGHAVGVQVIAAVNTTLSGNTILGMAGDGISLQDAKATTLTGNTVGTSAGAGVRVNFGVDTLTLVNNFIGVTATGQIVGNQGAGVFFNGGQSVTVGGLSQSFRNVISGNLGGGIFIQEVPVAAVVTHNVIGLNVDATTPVPGQPFGILVDNASTVTFTGNVVGGNLEGARFQFGATGVIRDNRVVANSDVGLSLIAAGPLDVVNNVVGSTAGDGVFVGDTSVTLMLRGNFIGVDANGTPLPNTGAGVAVVNSVGVTIGGPGAADANVISGNAGGGVVLGTGAGGARVENNTIGFKPDGKTVVAGQPVGVLVTANAGGAVVTGNRVGGGATGIELQGSAAPVVGGNRVSATSLAGISAAGDSSLSLTGNVIVGNSGNGITIANTNGSLVTGNFIGAEADGAKNGNIGTGVVLNNTTGAVIGGTGAERNVIANNAAGGIGLTLTKQTGVINNRLASNGAAGVRVVGSVETTLTGNDIVGNAVGVSVGGGSQTTSIFGNFIGIDAAGNVLGNTGFGVNVDGATDTLVGGPADNQRNVISGNTGGGVRVATATGTRVENNRVGTTIDGTATVAGQPVGVNVIGSVNGTVVAANTVAGHATGVLIDASKNDLILNNRLLANTAAGVTLISATATAVTGNVVGTGGDGVVVGPGSSAVRLSGNFIGVDANATLLPNQGVGVRVDQATDTLIGGETANIRNVVSGNLGGGAAISASVNTVVQDNFLGPNTDGVTLVAGQAFGVSVNGVSPGTVVAANRVGGNGVGVSVAAAGVVVRDNVVFSNVQTGISLSGAANVTVQANAVTGSGGDAISVSGGSTNARIIGNRIGMDFDGVVNGNTGAGVRVSQSNGVVIGGASISERNVISANAGGGVVVSASGTRVEGNFVGTSLDGSATIPGQPFGVRVNGGSVNATVINNRVAGHAQGVVIDGAAGASVTNNRVTGAAQAGIAVSNVSGVVLRGNTVGQGGDGIVVNGGSANVAVVGNFVGVDDMGVSLKNSGVGVRVNGSTLTVVGGLIPADRNVIAANAGGGVVVSAATSAQVIGNFIGTAPDGQTLPGNQPTGVLIDGNATGASVADNLIAGHSEGVVVGASSGATVSGNRVRFNTMAGIRVSGAASATLTGNLVGGNGDGIIVNTGATATRVTANSVGVGDNGVSLPNVGVGVRVANAAGSVIGGPLAADGNTVRDNNGGVLVQNSTNTRVENNAVTNNKAFGVRVNGGSATTGVTANTITGHVDGVVVDSASATTLTGNRVAANTSAGVRLTNATSAILTGNTVVTNGDGIVIDTNSAGTRLTGNFIGVEVNGTVAGNAGVGVRVDRSTDTIIGGSTSVDRNVVSGNATGVAATANAAGLRVVGNLIGFAPDGSTVVNGQSVGVTLTGNATPVVANNTLRGGVAVIQTTNATVSGNKADFVRVNGAANTAIANNTVSTAGVDAVIVSAGSTNTRLTGNTIVGGTAGVRVGGIGTIVGGPGTADRNVISGFTGDAVIVEVGATGVQVQGNFIGTNAAGDAAIPTTGAGVVVRADGAVIAGNTIAGHGGDGVAVFAAVNVSITGNRIGTNAAGTAKLANQVGVSVASDARVSLGDNLIAGNRAAGVRVAGNGSAVTNNRFGAAGLGNAGPGLDLVAGSSSATVRGNTFAENAGGVRVDGTDHQLLGNFIGTDSVGTDLGNAGPGIDVAATARRAVIGTLSASDGNTIRFNDGPGVLVRDGSSQTSVRNNVIFANDGLPIDVGSDGEAGPLGLSTAPRVLFANGGASTRVVGRIDALPNTVYQIDIYAAPNTRPSGRGEARRYLGSVGVTTDANGTARFSADVGATAAGDFVSATATDPNGNTTEFGQARLVSIDANEVNDTPETATDLGVFGVDLERAANIGTGTDIDYYRFTVTKGQTVEVQVFAERDGSLLDAELALTDAVLNGVAASDDFSGLDPIVRPTLTAGTYLVRVGGFSGTVGEYRLRLRDLGAAGPQVVRVTPSDSVVSLNEITVRFAEVAVNAATVTAAAFRLEAVAANGSTNNVSNRINTISFDAATQTARFGIGGVLADGVYRLTVTESLRGTNGQPLDGNNDGLAGGAFTSTFAVDTAAPTGTLRLDGVAGSANGGTRYRFAGTVSDAGSAAAGSDVVVSLDVDGDGFDDGTATVTLDESGSASFTIDATTAIPFGVTRTVRAKFTDAAGNSDTSVSLDVITATPVVTATGFDATAILVTFNRGDLPGAADAANYRVANQSVSGVSFDAATRTARLTLAGGLPEGVYAVTVLPEVGGATPLDGNGDGTPGDAFTGTVTVDRVGPTLTDARINPDDDTGPADFVTAALSPAIQVEVGDVFPGTAGRVTLELDADGDGFDDGSIVVDLTDSGATRPVVVPNTAVLPSGTSTVRVRATDSVGNTATVSLNVTIDRIGPATLTSSRAEPRFDAANNLIGARYVLRFDGDLDPVAAEDRENYTLFRANRDRVFYNGNDVNLAASITSIRYTPGSGTSPATVEILTDITAIGVGDDYQITARGVGLTDVAGNGLRTGDARLRVQLTDVPPAVESAQLVSAFVGAAPDRVMVQFRDNQSLRGTDGTSLRDGDTLVRVANGGVSFTPLSPNANAGGPVLASAEFAGGVLRLTFDRDLDPLEALRGANYLVTTPGADGVFGTPDDVTRPVSDASLNLDGNNRVTVGNLPGGAFEVRLDGTFDYDVNTDAVLSGGNYRLVNMTTGAAIATGSPYYDVFADRVILSGFGALPAGTYRLTVGGGSPIFGSTGLLLDGAGTGVAGSEYVRDFTVTAPLPTDQVLLNPDAFERNYSSLDAFHSDVAQSERTGKKLLSDRAFAAELLAAVQEVLARESGDSAARAAAVNLRLRDLFTARRDSLAFDPDEYAIVWGAGLRFVAAAPGDDPNLPEALRRLVGTRVDGKILDDLIPGAAFVSDNGVSLAIVPVALSRNFVSVPATVSRVDGAPVVPDLRFQLELEGLTAENQGGALFLGVGAVGASGVYADVPAEVRVETVTPPSGVTGYDPALFLINDRVLGEATAVLGDLTKQGRNTLIFWLDPEDFELSDARGRTVGFANGQEFNQIPGAFYSGNGVTELLVVTDALAGRYEFTNVGLGTDFRGAFSFFANDGALTSVPFQGALGTGDTVVALLNFFAPDVAPPPVPPVPVVDGFNKLALVLQQGDFDLFAVGADQVGEGFGVGGDLGDDGAAGGNLLAKLGLDFSSNGGGTDEEADTTIFGRVIRAVRRGAKQLGLEPLMVPIDAAREVVNQLAEVSRTVVQSLNRMFGGGDPAAGVGGRPITPKTSFPRGTAGGAATVPDGVTPADAVRGGAGPEVVPVPPPQRYAEPGSLLNPALPRTVFPVTDGVPAWVIIGCSLGLLVPTHIPERGERRRRRKTREFGTVSNLT